MKLSFKFPEEFIYSHTNDFKDGTVHHLFSVREFLFWVEVIDGVVLSVAPTIREELDMWNEESDTVTTDEEYEAHCNDVNVLNGDYIKTLQHRLDVGGLKNNLYI
tara:strand:- start:4308 stop:4622 length:315 start_codon:yes stop_codon:yes gene_type:complete